MKLYEILAAIENCYTEAVDEDGVIIEELLNIEQLDALEMARDEKIANIGKWIKNTEAEAQALKAEKLKLAERQRRAENKAASLKAYLDSVLNGQKFKTADGLVNITYRASKKLQAVPGYEEAEIAAQLIADGFADMVKVKAPELNKTALKNAILKDGLAFVGLEVVEANNLQVK